MSEIEMKYYKSQVLIRKLQLYIEAQKTKIQELESQIKSQH